jgi:hypothetical protein
MWLILILGSLIWVIFSPQRYRKLIKTVVEKDLKDPKNAHKFETLWLSIKPDGIHCATELGEARIDWRGIQEIVETKNYIFIYTGSSDAIILPKKFFSEESTLQDFVSTAKKYQEEVN